MAQLVEQRIRNAWVRGSSPLIGSSTGKLKKDVNQGILFFVYRGTS